MSKESNRLFGMYDHCDPLKVVMHKEVPKPRFEYQKEFLDYVTQILRESGRDVFLSEATTAIGPDAYVNVPTIRERQPGFKGTLRDITFRILDTFYGAPHDLRGLGGILYQLGDDFLDIEDPQVREALEKADSKYPHQHIPQMPLGTPLR
ncbi:hypothetical protein HYU07_01880 [Candidatus Woesearchaeota archaeon]|nr:hypothetical protein [Candidatus Woesearchaeota archaeon]